MKNRLKSIAAPKTWQIKRKKSIWIVKPKGPHKTENSLAIATLLREYLRHAKTSREIKNIIYYKQVLIDGRKVKKINESAGIMDIIEIPDLKEKYVMTINSRGKLALQKTELSFKIAKIIGKKTQGKTTQLNLFGGKNILVEKDEYKVGDTVLLNLKDLKIKEHLKFAEGMNCLLLGGSHIGEVGIIKKIDGNKIILTSDSGNDFETLKKFVYIVGKEKPLIKGEK